MENTYKISSKSGSSPDYTEIVKSITQLLSGCVNEVSFDCKEKVIKIKFSKDLTAANVIDSIVQKSTYNISGYDTSNVLANHYYRK